MSHLHDFLKDDLYYTKRLGNNGEVNDRLVYPPLC